MHSFIDKIIVAPMVRVSTLSFRLLCLDYGADLVCTEETIDFKMLRSVKRRNDLLGTTDFVDKTDGTVFFRTCLKEKNHLIFQIGTADPQRALKVAKMVESHVAGIDINMGCPKEFSIKGGMGSALLKQPDKVKAILTCLSKNLLVPVTCKIRILDTLEETITLCKLIESCGVAAITIHGRTKIERPNHSNHNDVIREVAKVLSIPVIANGGSKEIENLGDIKNFKIQTGAASVMIARAAMWNCSVFRKEGKLSQDNVIKDYLTYCIKYDNPFTFTKYTVQNILRELQSTRKGKAFLETQTLQEICSLWGLEAYFDEHVTDRVESIAASKVNSRSCAPSSIENIKVNITGEVGCKVIEMPLQFMRGNYGNADLPKMILHTYIARNGLLGPKYTNQTEDKLYYSHVEIDGTKYGSSVKEKSKRYAEQSAALVCLHYLGLVDKTYGYVPAEGTRKHQNYYMSEHVALKRLEPEDNLLNPYKLPKIEYKNG